MLSLSSCALNDQPMIQQTTFATPRQLAVILVSPTLMLTQQEHEEAKRQAIAEFEQLRQELLKRNEVKTEEARAKYRKALDDMQVRVGLGNLVDQGLIK